MDLELAGRTAVVFGGARGLGHAIAVALGREGARIALVDVSPVVHGVAEEFAAAGVKAVGYVADATDYAAVRATADRIRADFGSVDHVQFAVGIGSGQFGFPFWNVDPGVWDRVLRVNLVAAVNVAHAFAPGMAEARKGTFLFLSSVAGQMGSQTDPPYSAAKAGLINFAQCAAKDLAPFGVRVNTICPGMIKTDLNRSVWQAWAGQQPPDLWRSYEDWTAEKIQKVVPLNRWQTPEDVAAMAVFLASARAANVTGQTINVDGGFVMHW
ncbi:SDR family NAD(P)-dependent oxidoreductase [Fimbriiglobus ruber]|uniref:3-oxoacyl-[acyl-carrier protein] reductase n=1 Tax=Fimbriiglobus ruber TaxID=1908690 RepID=A0A225D0J5_9BACT|nr:SDR family oxidoreductase [Fimbriiglobus ruber]OWK35120.1 3-oxoacyl-[acyl-carrier protein] reductase [Fimbriiglobus ruber]